MDRRLIRREEVMERSKKDIGLKENETYGIVCATDGHKKRVIVTPVRVKGVYPFSKLFNFNNKNTSPIFVDIFQSD